MKRDKIPLLVFLLVFLVLIFTSFSITCVDARKHHSKKSRSHSKHHKHRNDNGNNARDSENPPAPAPTPLPPYVPYPPKSTIFDVLSFGAKGDGVSDDSKVSIMGRTNCMSFFDIYLFIKHYIITVLVFRS